MNLVVVARSAAILSVTALTTVALSACAGGILPGPSNSASPEPVYVTAPLTGVQYEEGTPQALQLVKPSVACKIDNGSTAPRPQSGLNSTDIVFDELVEGGLTRLVAVWHSSQPDAIGPVRSIRPMDPDIISSLGGIVCYSGGQYVFVKMMEQAPVFNASETSEQGKGTFSRSTDRIAPHNVIVNVQKLADAHTELSAPQPHFSFAKTAAEASAALAGAAVKSVTVKFPAATALWTPSKDGSVWLRTQDGQPLTDKLDGEQVHATNVVVLQVKIDRSYLDAKYGNVPKTIVVGSGQGYVFSGGKYLTVSWSKASATAPFVLTDAAGAPVLLAPGNTWVELQPLAPEGSTTVVKVPVPSASPSPSPSK